MTMRCSEPRTRLRPTFRVFAAHPLCVARSNGLAGSLILYLVRPMKSLLQFVLVAVAAGAILIDAESLGRAQEPSPSPPGTRREVSRCCGSEGVLARKPRVLYVGPLTAGLSV